MPLPTKTEKAAWVANLRSGSFPQGRDELVRGGRYCCLGVFCATLDVSTGRWHGHGALPHAVGFGDITCNGAFSLLNMPTLHYKAVEFRTLTRANDCQVPFSVLADHIEAYFPTSD